VVLGPALGDEEEPIPEDQAGGNFNGSGVHERNSRPNGGTSRTLADGLPLARDFSEQNRIRSVHKAAGRRFWRGASGRLARMMLALANRRRQNFGVGGNDV
jgi:hypothetical protein